MDGGWSWMVLLGSFVAYVIADGWAYSFGVLFPEMVDYFDESKGNTALVPTLLYGIPMIISPVVCAITAVVGCRKVAIVGGVLVSVALMLAALSGSFVWFCLNIGFLSSIGFAMTYVPAIVAVTCNFEKRRGLATGLAVTGSGIGSFAFPPFLALLMESYAWRGMLWIMAGICLNLVVAGALYRPVNENADAVERKVSDVEHQMIEMELAETARSCEGTDADPSRSNELQQLAETDSRHGVVSTESEAFNRSNVGSRNTDINEQVSSKSDAFCQSIRNILKGFWMELHLMICSMFDKSFISDVPFLCFCGANFFIFLWVNVPYVYLVDRAYIIGIDKNWADFLLSIIGIGRTVGQIVIGIVGDVPRVSSNVLYGLSVVVIGFATMFFPLCTSVVSLSVGAAVFGLFVSVTYVLPMMCLVEIVTLQKATNAFGLLQFVQGLGTLIGTPIVGFVFDMSGSYDISFFVAGAWILAAGVLICPIPLIMRYSRRNSD